MNLTRLRQVADEAVHKYRAAESAARAESEHLKKYERALADARSAQSVLQKIAEKVQTRAHEQLTRVVAKALQTVFAGEGYSFGIDFRRVRGRTEASMHFLRNGVKVDPTAFDSGGVTEVAAFALRLSCLLMSKLRRLLLLDEPFRQVSKEYVPRLRQLLESLAEELDLQVVMITHDPNLACGKVIKIGGRRGRENENAEEGRATD